MMKGKVRSGSRLQFSLKIGFIIGLLLTSIQLGGERHYAVHAQQFGWSEWLNDDFQDGDASDWQINDGVWSVVTDSNGNKAYKQSNTADGGTVLRGESHWEDYSFEADIKPLAYNGGGNSLVFRYSASGFYVVYMTESSIQLLVKSGSGSVVLDSAAYSFATGQTYRIKVDARGDQHRVHVNGSALPIVEAVDSTSPTGKIGLQTWLTSAEFDHVLVEGPTGDPTWTDLIYDDFEQGTASDWSVQEGDWSVETDTNGNKAYMQAVHTDGGTVYRGDDNWQDYTFEATIEPVTYNGGGNSLLFRHSTSGFYLVYMNETSIKLLVKSSSGETVLDDAAYSFTPGVPNRIMVDARGSQIRVYLNDSSSPLLEASDSTSVSGKIGLQTWLTSAKFDNVHVRGSGGGTGSDVWLEDTFEDGTADGWSINDGLWSVIQDAEMNYVYTQSNMADGGTVLQGESNWTNYSLEADIVPLAYNGGGNSLIFRYSSSGFYVVYMTETSLKLILKSGVGQTVLGSANYSFATGVSNRVKVEAHGDQLRVYLNNDTTPILQAVDSTSSSGKIGMQTWLTSASFDNVVVRSYSPEPVWSMLIEDDFESGNTEQLWSTVNGSWNVTAASNGNSSYVQSNTTGGGTVLRGEEHWEDYTFEADVETVSYNGGGTSMIFRHSSSGFYLVYITDSSAKLLRKSGGETVLDSASLAFPAGVTNRIKIDAEGSDIRVYLNDGTDPILEAVDSTLTSGTIGFQTWLTSARFDNVLVQGPYTPPAPPPDFTVIQPSAELTIIPGASDLTVQGEMTSPTLDPPNVYFRVFGQFGQYEEEITDIVAPVQSWMNAAPVSPTIENDLYVYPMPSYIFEPVLGAVTYTVKLYDKNGYLIGESAPVFAKYE